MSMLENLTKKAFHLLHWVLVFSISLTQFFLVASASEKKSATSLAQSRKIERFDFAENNIVLEISAMNNDGALKLLGQFYDKTKPRESGGLCMKDARFAEDIEDDLRFYKLRKYLRFASTVDSQTTSYRKTKPLSFVIEIKDRIGFEKKSSHLLWVLAGYLPQVYDCITGKAKDFSIELSTTIEHTSLELTNEKKIFLVFFGGMKTVEKTVRSQKIKLHYHSDEVLSLFPTIVETYKRLSNYSDIPKTNEIVETDYLFPGESNKVLLFNTGVSRTGKLIQHNYSNIGHWNLVYLLVDQWLTSAFPFITKYPSIRLGLDEYITGVILEDTVDLDNLFKPTKEGYRYLDLSYDAVTNLLMSLRIKSSTTSDLKTAGEPNDLNLFEGLRLAIGLKSLEANYTKDLIMQKIVATLEKGPFDSKERLSSFLANEIDSSNNFSAHVLDFWLKYRKLPDFEITNFESHKKSTSSLFTTKFDISHNYIEGQSVRVRFSSKNGPLNKKIKLKKNGATYYFISRQKLESAYVNPRGKIYEADKFNNRSGHTPVKFFPGSGNSLYDDKYLVGWLPTLTKNPSQPVEIGVTGAVIKYLWARVDFKLAVDEKGSLRSYLGEYSTSKVAPYTDLVVRVSQPDTKASFAELSIKGRGLWLGLDPFSASVTRRVYRILSSPENPDRLHEEVHSSSVSLSYNFDGSIFDASLSMGYENAYSLFEKNDQAFTLSMTLPSNLSLSARVFRGSMLFSSGSSAPSKNELARVYGYLPYDLSGARVRIDAPNIRTSSEILSFSNDFRFPVSFFSPGLGLLGNRLFAKVFYDAAYGRLALNSLENDQEQKEKSYYRATGVGFELPFGGDVMGGGTLILSQLTILLGLQQTFEGQTDDSPYILFSFAGNL